MLMSNCTLNVASFNVNVLGQKQQQKRLAIFNKLQKINSITFLQETHCSKKEEKSGQTNGKGKCISIKAVARVQG